MNRCSFRMMRGSSSTRSAPPEVQGRPGPPRARLAFRRMAGSMPLPRHDNVWCLSSGRHRVGPVASPLAGPIFASVVERFHAKRSRREGQLQDWFCRRSGSQNCGSSSRRRQARHETRRWAQHQVLLTDECNRREPAHRQPRAQSAPKVRHPPSGSVIGGSEHQPHPARTM